MENKFGSFLAILAVAALLSMADAAICNVSQLSPCLSAFTSSTPPSSACCNKLREQRPCLCQYYKNPTLRQYFNSPQAQRVAAACQVTVHC